MTKQKTGKRKKQHSKRNQNTIASQTKKPFEQDSKRRIGQFGGAGEPPLMKK